MKDEFNFLVFFVDIISDVLDVCPALVKPLKALKTFTCFYGWLENDTYMCSTIWRRDYQAGSELIFSTSARFPKINESCSTEHMMNPLMSLILNTMSYK